MKIAIVGCAHGEIEEIITAIQRFEKDKQCNVDLLICCGDFQAVRNENDLCNMACPLKYRKLHTFYKYYSGELTAPFPIIVIGGNHEASNYFFELYHGGWLAPNIYYLGASGSIMFGGLRISGLSGIFKYPDFNRGQFETLPMIESNIYSSYHVRKYNVWKLSQLHNNCIDIMLSHEWPTCIWKYGNYKTLLKYKSHFEPDLIKNKLGNPALNHLLFQLQPKQWFAGHLHCKFSAIVKHQDTQNITRFLALDKFDKNNKRRMFVQMLDFSIPNHAKKDEKTGFYKFEYDPVWLAIMKSTNKFMSINTNAFPIPQENTTNGKMRWDYRPTQEEINEILKLFNDDLTVPNNFEKTASVPSNPHDPQIAIKGTTPGFISNPQTKLLMDKLGIVCKLTEKHSQLNNEMPYVFGNTKKMNKNKNNNDVDDGFDDDEIFKWIVKRSN
eukprot:206603_1